MRAVLIQADVDHSQPFEQRVGALCAAVAAQRGADVVILPELWATGYFAFDDYDRTAEPLDGPTVRALRDAAIDADVHLHAGSIVERGPGDELFNTSLLLGPDGALLHSYRKVHLFGHQSKESAFLKPGEIVQALDTGIGRVGLAACYDLRFPELFRVLADDGAEMLLVAAAWPAERIAHWRLLVQARALENQAWVLACNAAGRQADVTLGGTSLIVDPWGRIVAEADTSDAVLSAVLDPADVARARAGFPAFSDRRIPTARPAVRLPAPPGRPSHAPSAIQTAPGAAVYDPASTTRPAAHTTSCSR
ncbi:nitrilase-related carbon-nitrogen hydrolase [Streptomyces sp. CB02923]|uniref:nitrilase-related carbon-nitrogen hydrolase n=1 Tax=Streptomyces sp. CB02923 TaxID=1718985 RepID=UPI0009393F88